MTEIFSTASGLDDGSGLLLANSLGTTTVMWEPQLPLLERYFKVVRFDTRGHGQSGTPPAPYSFDDLIRDALSVMDRHGLEKTSIMGCSLGAMTALAIGLKHPDRVERVICTAARADAPPPFVQNWDDRMAVIAEKGVAGLWDGSRGVWLTEDYQAANSEMVERLKVEFHLTRDEGYRGCAMALKTLDLLRYLGGMSVPTLYLAGAQDVAAAPDVMCAMAEATPGGQFATIPDAGHIINVNNPKGFNLAIAEFLGISVE